MEETIKIGTCKAELYEVDERLRIHDGKLCITKTPWENGKQSGFPEYIDVTEEVLNIICEGLKRKRVSL